MIDFLFGVLQALWQILEDASVYLLFGFLLAGVLAVCVPRRLLTRLVGTGRIRSVLWGSVMGAPLPLCSCGVLPTAVGLHKQGATPGATVAFLVATPETGADSISLTYALTDPLMTVYRPIAGVLTAIAAGILTNFFGATPRPLGASDERPNDDNNPVHEHGHTRENGHGHALDHAHEHDHGREPDHSRRISPVIAGGPAGMVLGAARQVVRYGFGELFDDVAWWLVLGLVLSAIVEVALPADVFQGLWGGGLASMLLMLLLSIPLYTCASSSTPIAAALALKGLSPGAALVFLIAGPATNIGSLVVLFKVLGARAVAVYLAAVAAMTLAAGFALNLLYRFWGLDPRASFGTAGEFVPASIKTAGAVVLAGLLVHSMWRTRVPDEWIWVRNRIASGTGFFVSSRGLASAAAIVALMLWLGSGFFTVGPGEVGVKLRFGRVIASDLQPGLHFRLAWPFESHRLIAQTLVRRLEFGMPKPPSRAEATDARIP